MKQLFIGLIRLYQYVISPFMAARCIHYPTCSSYAVEALEVHGFLRGSGLAMRRLLRCHPFSKGGYDPVPEQHSGRPIVDIMKEQQ